jgi:hypothetical protein
MILPQFANVNIGSWPGDGTGDPIRVSFEKINLNFANIANIQPTVRSVSSQSSTVYTIQPGDVPLESNYQGYLVFYSPDAVTVNVPANIIPAPCQIKLIQLGTGNVTVVAAPGCQVVTSVGTTTNGQYSVAELHQISWNLWVLEGNLT